ncbi:MAG: hypothetical protein ACRCZO_18695 [Cetobacterium sp.]
MFCKLFIYFVSQSSDIETADWDWEPVSKKPKLRAMTAHYQEKNPIPKLLREILPAKDQEKEEEDEGEGEGEGELAAAAAVKLRFQTAHLKRDGMMLTFQT